MNLGVRCTLMHKKQKLKKNLKLKEQNAIACKKTYVAIAFWVRLPILL